MQDHARMQQDQQHICSLIWNKWETSVSSSFSFTSADKFHISIVSKELYELAVIFTGSQLRVVDLLSNHIIHIDILVVLIRDLAHRLFTRFQSESESQNTLRRIIVSVFVYSLEFNATRSREGNMDKYTSEKMISSVLYYLKKYVLVLFDVLEGGRGGTGNDKIDINICTVTVRCFVKAVTNLMSSDTKVDLPTEIVASIVKHFGFMPTKQKRDVYLTSENVRTEDMREAIIEYKNRTRTGDQEHVHHETNTFVPEGTVQTTVQAKVLSAAKNLDQSPPPSLSLSSAVQFPCAYVVGMSSNVRPSIVNDLMQLSMFSMRVLVPRLDNFTRAEINVVKFCQDLYCTLENGEYILNEHMWKWIREIRAQQQTNEDVTVRVNAMLSNIEFRMKTEHFVISWLRHVIDMGNYITDDRLMNEIVSLRQQIIPPPRGCSV